MIRGVSRLDPTSGAETPLFSYSALFTSTTLCRSGLVAGPSGKIFFGVQHGPSQQSLDEWSQLYRADPTGKGVTIGGPRGRSIRSEERGGEEGGRCWGWSDGTKAHGI